MATARDPDAAEALAAGSQPLIRVKTEENGTGVSGDHGSMWAMSESKAGYLDDEKSVQAKSEAGVSGGLPSGLGAVATSGAAAKSEAGGGTSSKAGPLGPMPRITSRSFITPGSRLGLAAARGSGANLSSMGASAGGRPRLKRPVRKGGLRAAFGSDSNSESGDDSEEEEESESEDDAVGCDSGGWQ